MHVGINWRISIGLDPSVASALPHEVQVNKCEEDKDKTHEVNSEVTIFEERKGKIIYFTHINIHINVYIAYNYTHYC